MILDRETDTVYFSDWALRDFPTEIGNVCKLLKAYEVKYGFLHHTKDYWCRDYMPVQVDRHKYTQYTYAPDYLSDKKYKTYITNPDAIMKELGFATQKTALIIDGGNVIKCPDKVIMTEKIFMENRHLKRNEIISELENLFACEVVFLPWDKSEIYGHSDGIVRWIDGDKVLLTAYEQSRYFLQKFRKILEQHFNIIPMAYHTRPRNRQLTWAYINFLQTKNVIVVPAFGIKEDEQALMQIENAFPDYCGRIKSVDFSKVVIHGGGLNCISWNIKS